LVPRSALPGSSPPRLRLGFVSYDFNDHPTAHLVEAIFDVVRRGATPPPPPPAPARPGRHVFASAELVVYSYGHHDNSSYRARLEVSHTQPHCWSCS
jgi:hypothetical protein